ncbi:MAG: hypothetical protein L6R19_01250 [Alphaproteobacteria bacterium]|nr:hypothetical protein [Alphaproteobacteria bacterium]
MRLTVRIFALLAGLAALVLADHAARAQQPREGMLFAASYIPIPPGSPVTIHLLDDNDGARDLAESFRRELTQRGYKVVDRAPFTMTFWLTGTFDTGEQQARRHLLELGGEGGSSARTDTDVEARVNLFSTRGGGLFQDPPTRSSNARTGSRYRLYASVKEEATGKRAWIGQSYIDVQGSDPLSVAMAMVPTLAGSFGQTVRRQSFTLPQ